VTVSASLMDVLRRRGRDWKMLAKEFAETSEKNEFAKIDDRFVYLRARTRFLDEEDKKIVAELNARGNVDG
jgi:hypothetical protein